MSNMTHTNYFKLTYPVMFYEADGSISPCPNINNMERNNRNITLAVTLRGRTGNVLFTCSDLRSCQVYVLKIPVSVRTYEAI